MKAIKHLFIILLALASFSTANAQEIKVQNKSIIIEEVLSQFQDIAIKRVVLSDINKSKSHMYELHGIKSLVSMLGTDDKKYFNTEFLYITDSKVTSFTRKATWYLTGRGKYWEKRRFYYGSNNPIFKLAKAGDLMFIGKVDDKNLKVIIVEQKSKQEQDSLSSLELKSEKEVGNQYEESGLKIVKDKKTKRLIAIGNVSRVYDGDTFILDNLFKVRMLGIDTPEKKQVCQDKRGRNYKCGIRSKRYLVKLLGKRKITCEMHGWGAYNRHLFICKNSKGVDINKQMVRDGYAVMSTYKPFRYKEDEQYAKDHNLGLWSGTFQHPREFRRNKRK